MKHYRKAVPALVLATLVATVACDSVEVTYIGSAGYLLTTNSKKVLIDAPFDDFVKQFEVPVATQETQDNLANGEAPFNDIDLILITHYHKGHFDFELVGKCMKSNTKAMLVTTDLVYRTLEKNVPDFAAFKDRIVVPILETDGQTTTVTVADIPIHVSRSTHWGDEGYLYNYGFNLNGIEILFLLEQENYIKTVDIDLLFCNTLTSPLAPKHILLSHQNGYKNIMELGEQTSTMDDVTFLTTSRQRTWVTKEADGSIVIGPPARAVELVRGQHWASF